MLFESKNREGDVLSSSEIYLLKKEQGK